MDLDKAEPRLLRRSVRQSSKALRFEATPRLPIKRTKKLFQNTPPAVAVNGSSEEHLEEEAPPNKKNRRHTVRRVDGSQDKEDMDTHESDGERQRYEDESDIEQDLSLNSNHLGMHKGDLDDKVFATILLDDGYQLNKAKTKEMDELKDKRVRSLAKPNAIVTESVETTRSQNRQGVSTYKVSSMAEYRKTMDMKAKNTDVMGVTQLMSGDELGRIKNCHSKFLEKPDLVKRPVKNIQPHKEILQAEKKGKKTQKVKGQDKRDSSKGFLWYFCCLILLILFGSAAMFAFRAPNEQQRTKESASKGSSQEKLETFLTLLSNLKAQFLSQRTDLWTRSKIHLEKHLRDVQPTEPVSLILTAGIKAEKTLYCLAKGFASTFSSAHNGSVLHVNGTSKAGQLSDTVKLDVDLQLQKAFEGNSFAAVIHNLEELPPGSTILFYRYCDHEYAAYKSIFLLFTVLLPQDEVSGELMYVEEMVQDYLKERLVGSSSQTLFNEMDNDKFGGLWSRISHLILPVVSEMDVELKGC